MTLDPETEGAIDALPAFQPPATLGEVWGANWAGAGLSTPLGIREPRERALKELTSAYQRATGQDPYAAAGAAGRALVNPTPGEAAAVIGRLVGDLPDHQQQQVAPFLDIDARAAAVAQATEQEAAAVNQRTFGLTAVGTSYLAGIARSLVDPMTIAAAPLGGPEASGLATMLGREFLVNAGFGAANHMIVAPQREALGLENNGLLADTVSAGVFGAGLGLTLRGAGWAIRKAIGRPIVDAAGVAEPAPEGYQSLDQVPADLHAAMSALDPDDFSAAARFQDRETAMDAYAPRQDFAGRMDARAATDEAAARIETGEIADRPPGEPAGMDRAGVETGAPSDAGAEGEAANATAASPEAAASSTTGAAADVSQEATFETARGSKYVVHEDGTTTRDKAARADVGHEGDFGVKARSALTLYADPKLVGGLSAAGLSGLSRGARVVVDDGKATLLWWNEKAGKWGTSELSRDIPVSTTPEIGKAPIELWSPKNDVPGRVSYAGQHAGNAIVKLDRVERAPREEANRGEAAPAAREQPPSAVAPVKPLATDRASPDLAPQRADVERALEAAGGDITIADTDEAGAARQISARQALREADDYAAAAKELGDCIARFGAPKGEAA